MNQKTLEFYKEVGGYLTVVKFENKWFYAHNSDVEHLVFLNHAKRLGYSLQRVQGSPPRAVRDAYKRFGRTVDALKKSLPAFDPKWL